MTSVQLEPTCEANVHAASGRTGTRTIHNWVLCISAQCRHWREQRADVHQRFGKLEAVTRRPRAVFSGDRLSCSYKGFPHGNHLVISVAVDWVQGMWTAMLQTVMNASLVLADPDERRAPGAPFESRGSV